MATLPDLSSDEEEDMFVKPGAGSGLSSIYSTSMASNNTAKTVDSENEDEDEDDDMDELPKTPVKRKRRGRPKKSSTSASNGAIDLDADDLNANNGGKDSTESVFSANPCINATAVVDVDAIEEDEVNSTATQTLLQTAILLEKAKGKRGGPSLEARLEEESTREARRHVEKNIEQDKLTTKRKNIPRTIPLKDNGSVNQREERNAPTIRLRVRYEKEVVKMKILKSDPLIMMLKPFCERTKLDLNKAVMEVDGEEVDDDDTPDTYDLEDDNLIEVRCRK